MNVRQQKIETAALWIADQAKKPNTSAVKAKFGLSNSRAAEAMKRGTEIRRKRNGTWTR